MRLPWKEEVVKVVLELLRDTRVGCKPAVMARIGSPVEEEGDDSEGEGGGDGSEGEEGGPGPP